MKINKYFETLLMSGLWGKLTGSQWTRVQSISPCEERTQILAVTHARYGSDSTDTNILFKKDAMRDGHCIMNAGECQEVVTGV